MNGLNFKYIEPTTDLSIAQKMGWDVVSQGTEMEVYRIPGHFHTFGGRWGNNCYWACPRNEKPSYENLIQFEGHIISWGIVVEEANFFGDDNVRRSHTCYITRNGKKFYPVTTGDLDHGLANARKILFDIQEGPIDVNSYNFAEKLIGRKVFYYDQPAIVKRYNDGQGTIIVESETGKPFISPNYMPDLFESDETTSCVELFSKSIYWFRD